MAEKVQLFISRLLRLTMAVAIVVAIFQTQWTVVFASSIALMTTFLPSLVSKNYKLHFPIEFEFIITIFIYASIFLGEAGGFYTKFWWWDLVLHAGAAIIFGIIGFLILFTLYTQDRLKTNPLLLAIFSFTFAVAIGSIWEIFEFTVDAILNFNMQKSGLIDTMWDLIVNSIGALFASITGYYYIKNRGSGSGFLIKLINKFLTANPRLTKKVE